MRQEETAGSVCDGLGDAGRDDSGKQRCRDLTLTRAVVRTKRNCRTRLNLNFRLVRHPIRDKVL
jgi:hypothetical protein